jgi:hypothetical protein
MSAIAWLVSDTDLIDSMVIIIDQWEWSSDVAGPNDQWEWASDPTETRKKLNSDLSSRIVNFIDNNKIHTAVLSSYECSKELYSDTVWYRNRLAIVDPTFDYWSNLNYKQNTTAILLQYNNSDIFQIAMRGEKELEVYLAEHPKIKNIYVFGCAWELCVKTRLLGYENVYKKFCQDGSRRLLTSTDCILNYNSTIPVPDSNWVYIDNNIYQYCPD